KASSVGTAMAINARPPTRTGSAREEEVIRGFLLRCQQVNSLTCQRLGGPKMLKWLDAKEEHAFGTDLAKFYIERVPFESPFSTNQFAAKTQEVLKKVDLQVHNFKTGRSMNIYKKAKLGNA